MGTGHHWNRPSRSAAARVRSSTTRTSHSGTAAHAAWQPTVAGLGILALAGGAALSGQALATLPQPDEARPWLIAAAALGLPGVLLLGRDRSNDRPRVPDSGPERAVAAPLPRRRRIGGRLLMLAGGGYALIATVLVVLRLPEWTATWIWLLGITAVLAGASLSEPRSRKAWRFDRPRQVELGLLLAIIAVAAWLRLPDLASLPPNVHGDEASIGIDARTILAGKMPAVFATGWYDVPALSFSLHAVTMLVFGDDLFGLRMASAILGMLSVIVLYLLARRLWGPRPALLAAALMAASAWHIHFSRTGFHYIQAPMAMVLVLYLLVRAIQDRRLVDWLLCGLAIGLCVEVYYAARLAPVVAGLYLAYCAATQRGFARSHLRGVLALCFGAVVFLAPMAAVFARDPGNFSSRTSGVLITTPANLYHELDAYHVGSLAEVVAVQSLRTLEAFNIRGETSQQYGHPGPLFDAWTDALLAVAALGILLRPDSASGFLLTCWVWLTMILGSVLTLDAVFAPHVLVALPGLVLAPALLVDAIWRGVSRLAGRAGTYLFALPVALLLGLVLQSNIHDYFDVQVVERQPAGRFTLLSNYAASVKAAYRLYVIGRDDWTLKYETPRFLVPDADAVDVRSARLSLPLKQIPASKGVAFLVESGANDYTQRLADIRQSYPVGQEWLISERPGQPTFTSYLVENSALVAANSTAAHD